MSVKTRIDDTIIIIDGDGVMGALGATLRPKPGRKSSLYGSKRLYEWSIYPFEYIWLL